MQAGSLRFISEVAAQARGAIVMLKFLLTFLRDETGLTMVEYAAAGALITAACIAAFTSLGTNIAAQITGIAATITG